MVCLDPLTCTVSPVPILCHQDHSYAVEVYMSWPLFHVKVAMPYVSHPAFLVLLSVICGKEGVSHTRSLASRLSRPVAQMIQARV